MNWNSESNSAAYLANVSGAIGKFAVFAITEFRRNDFDLAVHFSLAFTERRHTLRHTEADDAISMSVDRGGYAHALDNLAGRSRRRGKRLCESRRKQKKETIAMN